MKSMRTKYFKIISQSIVSGIFIFNDMHCASYVKAIIVISKELFVLLNCEETHLWIELRAVFDYNDKYHLIRTYHVGSFIKNEFSVPYN
jgi:hypothetical protein